MPKHTINKSQICFTLFAHPKRTAALVWAGSMFSLLIPTCLKLWPLGEREELAKAERDQAQKTHDLALNELNILTENIKKSRQSILSLDCIIAGYPQFNNNLLGFQQNMLQAQAKSTDKLRLFWQMQFAGDHTDTKESLVGKSWTEREMAYDYYYSCLWKACPTSAPVDNSKPNQSSQDDLNCCYNWGWHMVDVDHYYNENTIEKDRYKNIIQGLREQIAYLDCGEYSRGLKVTTSTYVADESPKTFSGDRKAGLVRINFEKYFGSIVSPSYVLDQQTISTQLFLRNSAAQEDAADDLLTKLMAFLSSALAAFTTHGANYPAIQQAIRNNLPLLLEGSRNMTATLQETASAFAENDSIYNQASQDYSDGLWLWLPMFFLIPGGLALLAYIFCSNNSNSYEKITELPDVENPPSETSRLMPK